MKKTLRTPSPSLVISLIALFVALGGTAYAATSLPRNSVGTAQLKNGAVTGTKLHAGLIVPRAASPATLAHGRTEKGSYGFGAEGTGVIIGSISYPFPLAADPIVTLVFAGDPTPAGCTGDVTNPGAASGHLCIFEGFDEGGATLTDWFSAINGGSTGMKYGVTIYGSGGGSGNNDISGTWAATG